MRVAIAGSSGFIGSAMLHYLQANQVSAIRLVRKGIHRTGSVEDTSRGILDAYWNPDSNEIDSSALEGVDAIVNLAGENVHQRWTEGKKERMIASRVKSTRLLADTIQRLANPPRVFVCASGISYYHDFGSIKNAGKHEPTVRPILDESGPPGSGFLSELCQEWEEASNLGEANVRVVNLRIGIVLGPTGGVLGKLLPIFRAGLGGKWGTGQQFMSWIGIDDLVRVIHFAVTTDSIRGPVNAVSPSPITNHEFTKTLGKILSRPTIFTVPAWLARFAFGAEWADSTLLADYKISPTVLQGLGYRFVYPELGPALKNLVHSNHKKM